MAFGQMKDVFDLFPNILHISLKELLINEQINNLDNWII